jgi:hypothetical protein
MNTHLHLEERAKVSWVDSGRQHKKGRKHYTIPKTTHYIAMFSSSIFLNQASNTHTHPKRLCYS